MKTRRHVLLAVCLCLIVPGLASANHTDSIAGDGTFAPQLSVGVSNPIEGRAANLTMTQTQADHEDPTRLAYLRVPSGWQIAADQVRPAQNRFGSQDDFNCHGALSLDLQKRLYFVARAEIVGSMTLVATWDASPPRTTPIVYKGDVYELSWNPPHPGGLTLSTGVDAGGAAFIDAAWNPDPNPNFGPTLKIDQTGEDTGTYVQAPAGSSSYHFANLVAGQNYDVSMNYPYPAYVPETITAGTGTVRPTAMLCGLVTTTDSRIQALYDNGTLDARQFIFNVPLRRLEEGRWEEIWDWSSFTAQPFFRQINWSTLSVSTTLFDTTKGNWQLDPADPTKNAPLQGFVKNPPVSFAGAPWHSNQTFEGVFHSCHPHPGGDPAPCGTDGASDKADVTRTPAVAIYPGHAKPSITAPRQSQVLLGTNTVTIAWAPHPWSDPASDPVKGLKGYIVRVTPYAKALDNAECPSAIYCRGAANPILVNENGNGVTSDTNGVTSVVVSIPTDDWYAFRITALYQDGHTSNDTDLGSVKGYASGQFYAGTPQWPLVYMDTRPTGTLKNNSNPVLLFMDPANQTFSLVQLGRTLAGTEPAMAFAPNPTTPGEGYGSFSHTVYTGSMASSWNVTMQFTPDAAKGIWLYNGTNQGGNFDGARVR